jgi:hypothetical protein
LTISEEDLSWGLARLADAVGELARLHRATAGVAPGPS